MHYQQFAVENLKKEVAETRERLYNLERRLNGEVLILQDICSKQGHEYVAERNDDCHSPGFYYFCKNCQYRSIYKPDKFTFK
jgi:hypothetical protein